MRHRTGRYPLHKYIGTHALNLYQAVQPVEYRMEPGSLLVSVYGHRAGAGLLLGVWRVGGRMPAGHAVAMGLTKGSFEPLHPQWGGFFHELQETELLADLRLKLEVRWPGGERTWRRILSEPGKPSALRYPVVLCGEPAVPFQGLARASVVFSELRLALAELQWQQALSSCCAVYLISDELDGRHYVGSAYGAGGLLARWREYAATGHGGNKLLVELLEPDASRAMDLRFTILEPLPLAASKAEVVARENYWKVALGTRTFGLNSN